jgi:hypothetical protein
LTVSSTTIQYAIYKIIPMDYAVWYGFAGFFASIIGQLVFQFAIKKFKRTSWIVLLIASIIFISSIMMGVVGFYKIYVDFKNGAYMGFKFEFLFINKIKERMLIFIHTMSIKHSSNFLKVLFWSQKLQTNEFLLLVQISHSTILLLKKSIKLTIPRYIEAHAISFDLY